MFDSLVCAGAGLSSVYCLLRCQLRDTSQNSGRGRQGREKNTVVILPPIDVFIPLSSMLPVYHVTRDSLLDGKGKPETRKPERESSERSQKSRRKVVNNEHTNNGRKGRTHKKKKADGGDLAGTGNNRKKETGILFAHGPW